MLASTARVVDPGPSLRVGKPILQGALALAIAALTAAAQAPGEVAKLEAVAPGDFVQFGSAVAVSGLTCAVGAPGDGNLFTSGGAVHVFDRLGSSWIFAQKLAPADSKDGDSFGCALALDGQVLAAGARFDSAPSGTPAAGSVYVFERGLLGFVQKSLLFAPAGAANDQFGYALALEGDILAVGAPLDDDLHPVDPGADSGSVHVFERSGSTWVHKAELHAVGANKGDRFGISVDVAGDLILVGAPGQDSAGLDSGAAFVFRRNNQQWMFDARLVAPSGAADDGFGTAVSLSGTTVAVGAPRHAGAGAAYLFSRVADGVWEWGTTFGKVGAAPGDQFGASLELDVKRLVVGAPGAGVLPPPPGSAHLFTSNLDGVWSELQVLAPSDGVSGDRVGWAVALDCATSLVGAPFQGGFFLLSGSAFVFESFAPAEVYCTPKPSSNGCVAQIAADGVPSLSSGPYHVTASDVMNGKTGVLFYGFGGPAQLAFSGGTLCVLPPFHRGPVNYSGGSALGSDCSGNFAVDIVAWFNTGLAGEVAPGSRVDAQWWYRDPADPFDVCLSNGIEFEICP